MFFPSPSSLTNFYFLIPKHMQLSYKQSYSQELIPVILQKKGRYSPLMNRELETLSLFRNVKNFLPKLSQNRRTWQHGLKSQPIPVHIGRYELVSADTVTIFCRDTKSGRYVQNIPKISVHLCRYSQNIGYTDISPISRPIFSKYRARWTAMK